MKMQFEEQEAMEMHREIEKRCLTRTCSSPCVVCRVNIMKEAGYIKQSELEKAREKNNKFEDVINARNYISCLEEKVKKQEKELKKSKCQEKELCKLYEELREEEREREAMKILDEIKWLKDE